MDLKPFTIPINVKIYRTETIRVKMEDVLELPKDVHIVYYPNENIYIRKKSISLTSTTIVHYLGKTNALKIQAMAKNLKKDEAHRKLRKLGLIKLMVK